MEDHSHNKSKFRDGEKNKLNINASQAVLKNDQSITLSRKSGVRERSQHDKRSMISHDTSTNYSEENENQLIAEYMKLKEELNSIQKTST